MKTFLLFCIVSFFLLFPKIILASDDQFITIVNPVRISPYLSNPKDSLQAQYQQIKLRDLASTWLLTFDALTNQQMVTSIHTFNQKQELGIFMEVTPKLASASGVLYRQTDSWHRANSLFLSGYTQEERVKMIDSVFNQFNQQFGYYPVSVGAWWIDSFSLEYMQKKFGVTAYLNCSDQLGTDGYTIWGQYWSTPYYPSKYHAGIPASSMANKLDIVTMQWAPRDPFNGYGPKGASLYSTQDYYTIGLADNYFEKLIDLYAFKHDNSFGQVVIGLESDLGANTYGGTYAGQLDIAQKVTQRDVTIGTMTQFSNWYRSAFPNLSPSMVVSADDLLSKKIKSFWYQSPQYRIGLSIDKNTGKTNMKDLRIYQKNFSEPYYQTPNGQLDLFIQIPALLDSANNPSELWNLPTQDFQAIWQDQSKTEIIFKDQKIILTEDAIHLENIKTVLPDQVKKSSLVEVHTDQNSISIIPKHSFAISQDGYQFVDLNLAGTYLLRQKKVKLGVAMGMVLFLGLFILLLKQKFDPRKKYSLLGILLLVFIIPIVYFVYQNHQIYFVDQSEIDALQKLATLPPGKVLVYDHACLQCSWHSQYQPAAIANKRGYVSTFSDKQIVYNASVLEDQTRELARRDLQQTQAKYIYLTTYEGYSETLPFSPGDYNGEMIYQNAHAQIWRIH